MTDHQVAAADLYAVIGELLVQCRALSARNDELTVALMQTREQLEARERVAADVPSKADGDRTG